MKALFFKTIVGVITLISLLAFCTTDLMAQPNLTVINTTNCDIQVEAAGAARCILQCSSGTTVNRNSQTIINGSCSPAADNWSFVTFAAAGSAADSRSYNTHLTPVCGVDTLNTTCNGVLVTATWTNATTVVFN